MTFLRLQPLYELPPASAGGRVPDSGGFSRILERVVGKVWLERADYPQAKVFAGEDSAKAGRVVGRYPRLKTGQFMPLPSPVSPPRKLPADLDRAFYNIDVLKDL